MPSSAARWAVYPDTANNWFFSVNRGQPQNSGDPDMYVAEQLSDGGTSVRALDQNGQQLWRKYFTQYANHAVATPDGGLLLLELQDGSMVKLSSSGTVLWTQPNASDINYAAVAFDGTIYAGGSQRIAVFDGGTGALNQQFQIPSGTYTVSGNASEPTCQNLQPVYYFPPTWTPPFVSTNGKAYFIWQNKTGSFAATFNCTGAPNNPPYGTYSQTLSTFLQEMTPNSSTTYQIASDSFTSDSNDVWGYDLSPTQYWFVPFCSFGCIGGTQRIPDRPIYDAAPDGVGGILVSMQQQPSSVNQFTQDLIADVINGTIQYAVPPPGAHCCLHIALTDENTALLASDSGVAGVSAIDPSTGSALWSYLNQLDTVLSATNDGGVLVQDVTYDGSGAASTTITQLDPSGTPTGASVSFPGDLSSQNPQYFFTGELLLQDQELSAISDRPLPPVTVLPGMIFPVVGVGNNSKTHAAKGVTVKEFAGSDPKGCTGFDDEYSALMVPQTPNSNTLQIKAAKGHDVTLIPSGPLNAITFSPSTLIPGDGQLHQLTVSGGANTFGTFQVTAHSDDGTLLGTPFQIDVKPAKVITSVTIFSLVAPGLAPPYVPTESSLLGELNRIYPRQTNVSFTNVMSGGVYNFSYDKDRDGKLYFDANTNGKGCFPYPLPTPCRTDKSELGPALDSFYLPSGQHTQGDLQNFQAIYVNRISKDGVGGYSVAGDPTLPAILMTDFGTRSVVSAYRENLTAHEIGHILGVGKTFLINNQLIETDHNKRNTEYLMWYNNYNSAPCRISRDDWNLMNYTQGTLILGKDGRAH